MDFDQRFSKVGRYLEEDFGDRQRLLDQDWLGEEDNFISEEL